MDLTPGAAAAGAAAAVDPARYAIGGAVPRAAARPATREAACEALRAAHRDGLAVVPWGGGVALPGEEPPGRYDLALDLSALDRVVEYEPEDMTLTAECGVTLAALRDLLAARGQELPLEAARAGRATLGGALAANASGPRRLRFGAPRDRVLGARFALADGVLARAGGKVVKNVAGYGIHRLLCGSRGGLAVILEASLKVAPAPAARAALVFDVAADRLADAARWAALPRLEPAALTVVGGNAAARLPVPRPRADFAVIVGLEDDPPWVERQEERTVAALGEPSARAAGDEAAALWQALADLEEGDGPRLSFTSAGNSPAALSPILALSAAAGLVHHALAGRLHVFPADGEAPSLAATLAAHGFHAIGARGVAGLEPALPPAAATGRLRSRLRAAFDPGRRLALGDAWERG